MRVCLVCAEEYDSKVRRCPKDGTLLIELSGDPFLNRTIGAGYLLTEIIGKGANGVVYKSRRGDKDVAVRIFAARFAFAAETEDRVEWELRGKKLVTLDHPNVVRLLDFGLLPDQHRFAVYDYVTGESLKGPKSTADAVSIFTKVCDALDYAHRNDTLHGDVKPSNILMAGDTVWLCDFEFNRSYGSIIDSQTKCRELDMSIVSPLYLSPEYCMAKPLAPTADLYSLAISLFEILTGKPPFRGEHALDTVWKHVEDPIPMPFGDFRDGFFQKALAKKPEDRYQTALEFKEALQSFPR